MNKTKKIIALAACSLLLCGCSKDIPTLSDGSQAVVNFNEGLDAVSTNELYESLKSSYGLDAMITLMDTKILEAEYADDKDDAMSSAESTVDSMVNTYGEDYITQYFGSVDYYKNYVYLNTLQSKAVLDYAKTLVSEDEMKSYYDKNIYGDVTVDHILIKTGVTSDTSDEEKTKLENAAKEKVNEIIAKLNEAEDKLATFKELAKEYSDDEATKDNGGSLGAINTGSLSSSYDELLKAARELKDGEYSTELITTELGYHVIYRESSSDKPSYDDSKDEIQETLANDKLNADATIRVTAMDELRKKYGMDILDSDLKDKYSNYIANQIANAKSNN